MSKRTLAAVAVAAGLAASLGAQTAAQPPAGTAGKAGEAKRPAVDALTADEIVALNTAARGGLDAWRAVQTMRMSGRMDAGQKLQVPFTLQLKRPRKMRLEFLFEGQMVVQVYDGQAGWKRQPYLGRGGYELMTAEELQAAAGQAELDGPLIDYREKGNSVELLGREDVGGRSTYKLAVTLPTGAVRHFYLDAATLLESRVDGTRRLRGRERKLETYFRDYRRVQGLLVPYVVETREEGAAKANAMTIERVEVSPTLDDALFAPPPS